MNRLPTLVPALAVLAAAAASAPAQHHNHLTVDTAGGNAGDAVVIRAGYLPGESGFSISGGRLLHDGEIHVYHVDQTLAQPGPLDGWYAGDELLLTSDFYFATGRLDGGNFRYELASVVALSGGPGAVAWGDFEVGGFAPSAMSTDATRAGRSFDTMIAGHDHEQGYAFSAPGLYDVTFIAWDSNGRYADSAPVTARFNVVPAPGAAALLGLAGLRAARRRRA